MRICRRSRSGLFITVFLVVLLVTSFSFSFGSDDFLERILKNSKKNYHIFLMGMKLRMPEIDKLEFADNGTFTLISDLWDVPVLGTYEKRAKRIKGSGETGMFYDEDWKEIMEISCSFKGFGIGLRSSFIIGSGVRQFAYPETSTSSSESIIFMGLAFR